MRGFQDRKVAFGNPLQGEDIPSPVLNRSARGFFVGTRLPMINT